MSDNVKNFNPWYMRDIHRKSEKNSNLNKNRLEYFFDHCIAHTV